jgi:hypothetical protein
MRISGDAIPIRELASFLDVTDPESKHAMGTSMEIVVYQFFTSYRYSPVWISS